MTTIERLTTIFAAAAVAGTVALRADADRLQNAATVLSEMSTADPGIPPNLWAKAKCVVVIPGVKKAALGIGGQYGRGYMSCRNDSPAGWSAPGAIRIEGGSVGLQIGGSDTDVIMLVLNDRGVDRLLSSKFTVGADAAVAAGPVGRQANAQTDATMMAEILAWSRSRGAFAGLSLQGSTLRDDDGENKELYGREIPNKDIVKGSMAAPASAKVLIDTLSKFKPE